MSRRSRRRPLRSHLPFAPQADPLFRWRSTGVSRLEGLADAVFAFTVTLLVVALEVPRDYAALMRVLEEFPSFAATFAILIWFWNTHYTFFRRYGLEDAWTRFLNAVVLLLIVFLAYPLKFLFTSAFAGALGWGEQVTGIDTLDQLSRLYIVYGTGLAGVWFVYFLSARLSAARCTAPDAAGNHSHVRFALRHAHQHCGVPGLDLADLGRRPHLATRHDLRFAGTINGAQRLLARFTRLARRTILPKEQRLRLAAPHRHLILQP